VIARLARGLGFIDDDDRLGRNGPDLVQAWAQDHDLIGVLDARDGPGSRWVQKVARAVTDCLEGRWPSDTQALWHEIAAKLHPADMAAKGSEQSTLRRRFDENAHRRRIMKLLRASPLAREYKANQKEGGRGYADAVALRDSLPPLLGEDDVDRHIGTAIVAVDVYERIASSLQEVFDAVRWTVTNRGGRAKYAEVLGDTDLRSLVDEVRRTLLKTLPRIEPAVSRLLSVPTVAGPQLSDIFLRLGEELEPACGSTDMLVKAVILRHEHVQKTKRKAPWVLVDDELTLMPGQGIAFEEAVGRYPGSFMHPFRVANSYSLLADLGLSGVVTSFSDNN